MGEIPGVEFLCDKKCSPVSIDSVVLTTESLLLSFRSTLTGAAAGLATGASGSAATPAEGTGFSGSGAVVGADGGAGDDEDTELAIAKLG
jgi:hypothetical protein